MRTRAAVLAVLAASLAEPAAADELARHPAPVGPPPLAFRSTTLDRTIAAIDVRVQAMTEVQASIVLTRRGHELGHRTAVIHTGQTIVGIHIAPRTLRRLHVGQHVDVDIYYGRPEPVHVARAELLAGAPALTL